MASAEERKLYVGALPTGATEEELRRHFEQFGEVAEVVVKHRYSGSPRCFGFVIFVEAAVAQRTLAEKHFFGGRTIEVRRAYPPEQRGNNGQTQHQSRESNGEASWRSNGLSAANGNLSGTKIFVGGLAPSVTEVELRGFFGQYGPITDAVVMFDNITRRTRGFGFITFESEEDAEKVLKQSFYELNGKSVEVKKAVPKEPHASSNGHVNANVNGRDYIRMGHMFREFVDYQPYTMKYSPQSCFHPQAFGYNYIPYATPYGHTYACMDVRSFWGTGGRRCPVQYGMQYYYPYSYRPLPHYGYDGTQSVGFEANQSLNGSGNQMLLSNGMENQMVFSDGMENQMVFSNGMEM